jgi:glycosyltransferase involved in cell wall biosynthesis
MSRHPLFVTRKFPPSVGGMETLAAGVWRSLSGRRPDALLIAHGGSNRQLPCWLLVAAARVLRLLAGRRVAPVLVGDALMYAVLYPLLRLFRVPNGTMVMGLDLTYPNRAYRAVVHRVLRRAPRVIAISAATAEVARSCGVPADRLSVVRLGVAAPTVTAEDRTAAARQLRRRYDLPDDAVVLLTLGRLVQRKGARWFAEQVLPGLPARVVYLVVGDGPEAGPIRAAAVRAGVAGRVRLLGRVDDEARELLMSGAEVFVQPNVPVPGDMEGFGLVAVEAAMRGTPTVASGIEGLRDAVVDGETGILLPAGDPVAWTERLTGLVADPLALADTGARFQARARELYSEERMADALLDQLASLAGPDRGPAALLARG